MMRVKNRGGNPFNEIQLPEMLLKLKQGAGRLIRGYNDYGIVAILDNRVLTKSYRTKIYDVLPKAKVTNNIQELADFLNKHKK